MLDFESKQIQNNTVEIAGDRAIFSVINLSGLL